MTEDMPTAGQRRYPGHEAAAFPGLPLSLYAGVGVWGWEGCGNGRDDHPGYTIIYGAMSLRGGPSTCRVTTRAKERFIGR